MIVNKFGGASIKNTEAIQRMANICKEHMSQGVIVVSAMGKTTNLLEKLTHHYYKGSDFQEFRQQFESYHRQIIESLFPLENQIFGEFSNVLKELDHKTSKKPSLNYDYEYDQIVSFGEMLSTRIVAAYLNLQQIKVEWVDIRNCLKTDSTFREGRINWELTGKLIAKQFADSDKKLFLTQGFIGSDQNNQTTTLGREGSDYTAAIIANSLNAQKVVVWKDVVGILCADPDWMSGAEKITRLSYADAIELTYYGAKVIHPKTVKPLQNKEIPLQVRSFLTLSDEGTLIGPFESSDFPPVYIKKEAQVLVSIRPLDFSFIMEENLSHIFAVLAKHQIQVNLMQTSALNFSISVDTNMDRVPKAIEELKLHYKVKYNDQLELITIRHYKPGAENKILEGKTILVEQRSRTMSRFILR
ncbi:MAG: aspartate kinase [Salinivirgaceae bacterium]|nr:aspartate kinase [Salinivirgaceae bacterium]